MSRVGERSRPVGRKVGELGKTGLHVLVLSVYQQVDVEGLHKSLNRRLRSDVELQGSGCSDSYDGHFEDVICRCRLHVHPSEERNENQVGRGSHQARRVAD